MHINTEQNHQAPDNLQAVSFDEFSKRLGGISHWTARRWAKDGKIRTIAVGSRRLIPISELRRAVEQGL